MGTSLFEEFERIRKESVYQRGYFFYKGTIFSILVVDKEDVTTHERVTSVVELKYVHSIADYIFEFSALEYINTHKKALLECAGRLLTTLPKRYAPDEYMYEYQGKIRKYEIRVDSEPLILFDLHTDDSTMYYEVAHSVIGKKCYSYHSFVQKIAREHEGMTLAAALDYLREKPDEFTQGIKDYDESDPIISISKPSINRETGNKDKNTFDFIAIEILLRSDLEISDISEYIKENLVDFDRRARKRIADYKPYRKFGVPVEFLSLYGIATRGRSCLEFRYELQKFNDDINN